MKNISKVNWDQPDFREEDIQSAILSLNNYIGAKGPVVEQLEIEFAKKIGSKYAVAVDNGTNALVVVCMVLKHLYGELTIGVPNFTFIASANAPQFVFNNIKFLDIEKDTWNIDPAKVEGVDAIMAVDVAGLPVDYDRLNSLGLPLVCDSAESAGAKYKGKYVGTQALMHTYSLHRSKLISSGEGGMITTNDKQCYDLLKSYCNHGYDFSKKAWEYKHKTLGLNFRMSDVHAAIALSQLNRLDEYVSHRREMASVYDSILTNHVIIQTHNKDDYHHNYFLYGVLVNDRDRIVEELNSCGIVVKTWSAIASQECYNRIDPPVSKEIADRILLLPIHNQITKEEVVYVANTLIELL